jgi:hypothetical protein
MSIATTIYRHPAGYAIALGHGLLHATNHFLLQPWCAMPSLWLRKKGGYT